MLSSCKQLPRGFALFSSGIRVREQQILPYQYGVSKLHDTSHLSAGFERNIYQSGVLIMANRVMKAPVASLESASRRKPFGAGIRPSRRGAIAIVLAVMAVVLVACGSAATPSTSDSSSTVPTSEVSNPSNNQEDLAPNFEFTLFQGEEELGAANTNLHQLTGRPVVLNFWAGLCPPCRAEMPDLQEFHDEFKDRVTLLGIDLGQFTGLGTLQDAKNLLEELEITYPAGSTEDTSVISNYRVFGMPTTVFIDAEGKVFKNWGGALNAKVLREQTNKMLSQ